MLCSNLTCDYGFRTIPDTYCSGVACRHDRDHGTCCEPGLVFKYFRFTPLLLRYLHFDAFQIAELVFFFHGLHVSLADEEAYSINGNAPGREMPEKAVDGNWDTKWLDYDASPMYIKLNSPKAFDAYQIVTADDLPTRDPIRWRIEGSEDDAAYILLHEELSGEQAEQEYLMVPELAPLVPMARKTATDIIYLGQPCLAPMRVVNALSPSCAEGRILVNGTICTSQCEPGFEPSIPVLECVMGSTVPHTFRCDAL
mmetsp:Transcript_111307/g.314207  ORF Transcript_111307/g.314207 Transcript_111307/m.314207 type:complete len:255 (+) Transcript_111307:3-767(+)